MNRMAAVGILALGCALPNARESLADGIKTDTNIVTAIDISDSVDSQQIRNEIEGIAGAILAPEVHQAIERGRHGQIGFAVFAWHHGGIYPELVSWTLIASENDAVRVSNQIADCLWIAVEAEGRKRSKLHHSARLTDVSAAIDHAAEMLLTAPYSAKHEVVNIVGNGVDNLGEGPQRARNSLVGQGVTINGVVLGEDLSVIDHYRQHVIGGWGAFLFSTTRSDIVVELLARKFRYDIAMHAPVMQW